MAETKGTLSINSDNIFPIIKKWLYSDHDIFFRELISNGCDAITKLKKLDMMGEYNFPEGHKNKVEVILDPEKKTLKFIDTGLGMTADEVEKYITQIAFSGATQFLEQYKDKTEGDQIIGHFGLGFYSAFMVADEVTIDTLSYKEGAEPVHWTCDGGTEYTMATGTKETVGTEITLFLNEESTEFANEYRAREIIEKYCSFMPTDIAGFSIYHQGSEEFEFKEGAAMTNLLLADEINRTSPKTQSALLEAMEEGQITVDGITRDLPDPYIVIATQNPFGSIGTHSLPESQLDRFMIRTSLGYPDMESEIKMLAQGSVDMTTSGIEEQISVEELRKAREEAARLFVHEDILRYIVEIANETRRSRDLELGISPRGTIALLSMAKANAYLEGRDYVIPQDVKDVFFETIEHRVIRSKEAKVQRKTKEEILKAILYKIPLPKGNQKG